MKRAGKEKSVDEILGDLRKVIDKTPRLTPLQLLLSEREGLLRHIAVYKRLLAENARKIKAARRK